MIAGVRPPMMPMRPASVASGPHMGPGGGFHPMPIGGGSLLGQARPQVNRNLQPQQFLATRNMTHPTMGVIAGQVGGRRTTAAAPMMNVYGATD